MSIYRIPYFLRCLRYFDVCPNDSYFVIKILYLRPQDLPTDDSIIINTTAVQLRL